MTPEPPPDLEWLIPWERIDLYQDELVKELRREMPPGHVLSDASVAAVARRIDCDDVLFATDHPAMPLAVVHLTWSRQVEPDPEWPHTIGYTSWDDWIQRCLLSDHREIYEYRMSTSSSAPKFARYERVIVVGQEDKTSYLKGERGVVAWLESYHVVGKRGRPDGWQYLVHLPRLGSWRTFWQADLASEGGFEPESVLLGSRPEISFDFILIGDNDWVEGSYRLPREFWKVVIFERADVPELRRKPSIWRGQTEWESEMTGVVIQFPQRANMGRDDLLRAMSQFFEVSDWAEVSGPDSMVLR